VFVAEARLLVPGPTAEDTDKSLAAVRQARRAGYPRENLKKNRTLTRAHDRAQLEAALDTAPVAPPPDPQPYLVRPDW
jgi:hypothetical protein